MTFDGFFIYHLIKELNQNIEKARLEKIYQKDDSAFAFVFYIRKERHHLTIDLDPNHFGMYLTKSKESYQHTSQFLMTLKKHLEGAILEEITQHQTDRVMICHFTVYDFILGPLKKTLVFEAMGKHSNLILVQDETIIDTFKKMFFESGRQLLPQARFEFFPTDKKPFFEMNEDDLTSREDLVKTFMGVSPLLASYLVDHHMLLKNVSIQPVYIKDKNKAYVIDVFKDDEKKVYTNTLSELFEIDSKDHKPRYLSERQFISKSLKKYEKKRELLHQSLDLAKDGLNERNLGDMIYASGLNLSEKHSEVQVNETIISLDPTLTLNENAQLHYKNYQKYKRSIEHIRTQIEENESLIDLFMELDSFIDLQSDETIKDFDQELNTYGYKAVKQKVIHKKLHQKPKFLLITDQYATYAVGKNNVQNEYLTHTYAKKEDFWFHVKDAPGAHVIVQADQLNEQIIRKASMLAAYFSKLKASSSIPVDYTQIKHLKKIPGKPRYQVIYQHYKTMFIDIDDDKIQFIIEKESKK